MQFIKHFIYIFQFSDVKALHAKKCPRFKEQKLQLSCDGVHENKSSRVSLDVYSVNIKDCKNIYPLKIVRPLVKEIIDHKEQLRQVACDITDNYFRIMQYIADNLKRAVGKDCKNHASWFPCEYCYAKGTKIEISKNLKQKRQLHQQITIIEEKIAKLRNALETPESQSNIQNLLSLKNDLQRNVNALKKKSNIL